MRFCLVALGLALFAAACDSPVNQADEAGASTTPIVDGAVPVDCPVSAPMNLSPCDSSGGEAHCAYDCTTGHGASYYASCTDSAWRVEIVGTDCADCGSTCDAGAVDAGAIDADADGG